MSSKFTPQEIADFKESFDTFDMDRNGSINASELRSLLRVVGQKYHTSSVDNVMKLYDTNGDKSIDFNEFIVMADKLILNRIED
ncbi:hypothetical protein BGZ76_002042 [Entomortierella beljakovae]|nr:hypothetical protein BGZ76_002042 [Entomortierella beljakovae]